MHLILLLVELVDGLELVEVEFSLWLSFFSLIVLFELKFEEGPKRRYECKN